MTAAGGPGGDRPRRLHLPRPVRRPRPDHGPHPVMLGTDVSPTDLLQGRSPRLDLDSLYGAGPGNPGSAAFYEADGHHLKTGTTIAAEGVGPKAGHDLPRVGTGPGPEGEAQGADPRPAQRREPDRGADPHARSSPSTTRSSTGCRSRCRATQRFRRARKRVTLHYQWLLRHDYLPRIVDPADRQPGLQERSQGGRARSRADLACRRCRSSSRSPRSGSGTAWSGRRTTGTRTSPATPAASTTCSSSPPSAATSVASGG